jgi:uncharacterized membrane protein YkoI
MKIRTVALSAIALSAAAAFAMTSPSAERPLKLAEMVAHMESHYPGEVVAIAFDASGDKRAHYHVDMRFPTSGLASVDVDAVTRAIASRDPVSLPAGSAKLPYAAALVSVHVPGQVLIAELDAAEGVTPHYDVDVRLPEGSIARLKVDPVTRDITWREPAIVDE